MKMRWLLWLFALICLVASLGAANVPTHAFADTAPPTVLAAVTPASWTTGSVTVTMTASDQSGVATTYCKKAADATFTAVAGSTCQVTLSANGNVQYYAVDNVGNTSSTFTYAVWNIDTAPPICFEVASMPDGISGWFVNPAVISSQGVDVGSNTKSINYQVQYAGDASFGPWISVSGTNTNITLDRSFTMNWYAEDNMGNRCATRTVTKNVDPEAPVLTVALPGGAGGSGWYSSGPIAATVSATDGPVNIGKISKLEYRLNNSSWAAVPGSVTGGTSASGAVPISTEGDNLLEVRATDPAGTTGTFTAHVLIDSTAPVLTESLPAPDGPNSWYLNPFDVTLGSSDPESGITAIYYRLMLLGQNYPTPPAYVLVSGSSFTLTGVNKSYQIDWYAVNGSGAVAATRQLVLKVDVDAPAITLTGPAPDASGWHTTGPVVLHGVAAEAPTLYNIGLTTFPYRINSGSWTTMPASGNVTISADGAYTVDFRATDAGGRVNTQTATVNLDVTIPVGTVTKANPDGLNNWYKYSPVNVTLGGSDGASGVQSLHYRLNGGSYSTVAGSTKALSFVPGVTQVDFYIMDNAGHTSTTQSLTIKVNTTSPSVTVVPTTSPVDGWYTGSVAITVVGNAPIATPAVLEYQVNGGSWTAVTGGQITINQDGTNNVTVRATDNSGLVTTTSLQVKIDALAPVLSVSAPTATGLHGWYKTSPVTITLNVSDTASGSGVKTLYYRLNGGSYIPVNGTTQPLTFGDGVTQVAWYAVDYAGLSSAVETFSIKVNTAGPTLTAVPATTPANGWYGGPVDITVAGNAAIATPVVVEYQVNGGSWAAVTGGKITISQDGTNYVSVRATDDSGFVATVNLTVKLDIVVPAVSVSTPTADGLHGWFKTSPVTVTLTGADSGSGVDELYYRTNGGSYLTVDGGSKQLTFTNGQWVVDYYAEDHAGLTSAVQSFTINVDTILPAVSAAPQGTPSNGWHKNSVAVIVDASDANPGAITRQYQLNGGAWFTIYDPSFLVTLSGTHNVTVRATDYAGNVATTALVVKVDATAPALTATFPQPNGANGWFISPVTVNAAASDVHSGLKFVSYSLDGAPNVVGTQVTINQTGIHTLSWYAEDNLGLATMLDQVAFKLDLIAPSISASYRAPDGLNGLYITQPVVVTVGAGDPDGPCSFTYSLDGVTWQPVDGPTLSLSNEGTNNLYLRAVDQAGRVVNRTVTIVIDTTPPGPGDVLPPGWVMAGWLPGSYQLPGSGDLPIGDVVGIEYRMPAGSGTWSTTPPVFAQSGTYILEIKIVDSAGHVTIQILVLKLDFDGPVLTTTPPANSTTKVGGTVDMAGTVTDTHSGVLVVEYTLDNGKTWMPLGAANGTFQFAWDTSPLRNGLYPVTVRARDAAGNSSTSSFYLQVGNVVYLYLPSVVR